MDMTFFLLSVKLSITVCIALSMAGLLYLVIAFWTAGAYLSKKSSTDPPSFLVNFFCPSAETLFLAVFHFSWYWPMTCSLRRLVWCWTPSIRQEGREPNG